jgi:hypothetical protein
MSLKHFVTLINGERIDNRTFKSLAGAKRHRQELNDFKNLPQLKIHRINADGEEERYCGLDDNGKEEWSDTPRNVLNRKPGNGSIL